MKAPIIIVGAGGHAKVLIDALKLCRCEISGIVDSQPSKTGTAILGVPVLGGDDVLADYPPDRVLLVNGIGSVDRPSVRRRIFNGFKERGYRFATVIHPSAVISSDATLGEGAQVMAGAVVQAGAQIGHNSVINTRASIDHDCRIGAHVHIAPGTTLSGDVVVGDGTHIGTGATVMQGISIGEEVLVAAGSTVIRDAGAGETLMGVPARPKSRP